MNVERNGMRLRAMYCRQTVLVVQPEVISTYTEVKLFAAHT